MKTCVITGAGSGIGRAAAVEIAKLNEFTDLALIGRREDNLQETARMIGPCARSHALPFDLAQLEKIPDMVKGIYETCKSIDCLLNVAGHTDPQPLLTTTLENIKTTYAINVFAPFMLSRECVKYMRSNTGISKILNVASTAGISTRPGWLSYASSKASVVAMSQTLSEELAEYNIRVYCVSPGRCATALRRILAPAEDPSTIMQPEEVGRILAALISDKECCLDGQNIVIRKK